MSRLQQSQGADLSTIDPESESLVSLFNPRTDEWHTHFVMLDARIFGRTPVGRATASLLRFNDDERLRVREELLQRGDLS